MRLIVDTNIILAALLKEGITRHILLSNNIDLFLGEHVLSEIGKWKGYIFDKSTLSDDQIELLLSLALEKITIIPAGDIKTQMNEAMEIMRAIDENDAPILACALAIKNDGIWTEDKHFLQQTRVKVWQTKDLISFL